MSIDRLPVPRRVPRSRSRFTLPLIGLIGMALVAFPGAGTGDACARTVDLLELPPLDHGVLADVSLSLEDLEVEGAARHEVRGDTLDVVLVGRPARLHFRLPPSAGASIDAVHLRMSSSEPAWIRPLVRRLDRENPAGPSISVGAMTDVEIPLYDSVVKSPRGGLSHAVIALPSIVGRVKLVAPFHLVGSSAPRRVARLRRIESQCRALALDRPATWRVEVPVDGRFRADLAHGARTHADERLTLYVRVEAEGGEPVAHERALPLLARSGTTTPWHAVEVDLAAFAGRAVELTLEARTNRPAPGLSRLLLGSPRLVRTDTGAPSVLVMVVDTLRDHDPGTTSTEARPRMTELAAQGIEFRRAYANSSWTLPSTGSLLAGWLPSRHGLGHGPAGTTQMHPEAPSLAESLRGAGWATVAVSANPIVSAGTGLERGFEHFDTRPTRDPHALTAETTLDAALDWARARVGEPWLLYVHFFDPHDRYQAPDPWRLEFVDPTRRRKQHPAGVWRGKPNPIRDAILGEVEGIEVREKDVELLGELYRGEVAYVDAKIGALVDSLSSWGEFDDTAVVLTSDHGEEFFEHGMLKHGHALHEELIAVPLAFRLPGVQPAWVDTPVSLVDLAPTLLGWLGLEPTAGDGQDLLADWPAPPAALPVVGELISRVDHEDWEGRWRSVVEGYWKWVEGPEGERLFDLERDPGEFRDVADEHPEVVRRLRAVADAMKGTATRSAAAPVDDARRRELLRSLGYIR